MEGDKRQQHDCHEHTEFRQACECALSGHLFCTETVSKRFAKRR
jgi:hypothetical protein